MAFPANQVEQALEQVVPGRYDAYEQALRALADGQVWMLLWEEPAHGPVRYADTGVDGWRYVPAVTSQEQLAAARWDRGWRVHPVIEVAHSLYPARRGLWLNPHRHGGVGVPWLDLRRIAAGLTRIMAGPVRVGAVTVDHALAEPSFQSVLARLVTDTGVVRAAHQAWAQPSVGAARLVLGLRLVDGEPATMGRVRRLTDAASQAAPHGVEVTSVPLDDEYDPVAAWMREHTTPFAGTGHG